jgi:hypothetical protein
MQDYCHLSLAAAHGDETSRTDPERSTPSLSSWKPERNFNGFWALNENPYNPL